jgi:deoxyribose-phosphate aldolase
MNYRWAIANTMIDTSNIAAYIDHTLLKPDAGSREIEKLCNEARAHHFFGVCVNGSWVETACRILQGSEAKVISVVGFPLGAMCTEAKCREAECAILDGAREIDLVLNLGRLKDGDRSYILNEIKGVAKAAQGRHLKVIIETCLLSNEEKIQACRLAVDGGAHYVKTSTGFSTGGATVSDVRLMRGTVGPDIGVKASGGIRDLATAVAMIEAGATRLGASASVAIIKGEKG